MVILPPSALSHTSYISFPFSLPRTRTFFLHANANISFSFIPCPSLIFQTIFSTLYDSYSCCSGHPPRHEWRWAQKETNTDISPFSFSVLVPFLSSFAWPSPVSFLLLACLPPLDFRFYSRNSACFFSPRGTTTVTRFQPSVICF